MKDKLPLGGSELQWNALFSRLPAKLLENKNLILRTHIDNRSKNILLTDQGLSLISSLIKIIKNEEIEFFNKLGNETFNLTNSLKLLLGKKIRIKAYKNNE